MRIVVSDLHTCVHGLTVAHVCHVVGMRPVWPCHVTSLELCVTNALVSLFARCVSLFTRHDSHVMYAKFACRVSHSCFSPFLHAAPQFTCRGVRPCSRATTRMSCMRNSRIVFRIVPSRLTRTSRCNSHVVYRTSHIVVASKRRSQQSCKHKSRKHNNKYRIKGQQDA